MRLVNIGSSKDSPTKSFDWKDLKDHAGNPLQLPPNPAKNLSFDPRPNKYDWRYTFDVDVNDTTVKFTVTNYNARWGVGWGPDLLFRV